MRASFWGPSSKKILEDLNGPLGQALKKKLMDVAAAVPFVEALDSLERVARAVCHIVNVNPDPKLSQPKAADVQFFMAYAGRAALERQWKSWFSATNEWWTQEVQSILKVSGRSILLQPKVEQLQDLLEKGELSRGDLSSAIDLYVEVSAGTREIVHKPMGEDLLGMVTAKVKHLLEAGDGVEISTPLVDMLLRGLQVFAAQPGVLSLSQQLRLMATSKVADIAGTDLCSLMEATVPNGAISFEDFGKAAELVKRCTKLPENLDAKTADHFLLLMVQCLSAEVRN